MTDSPPTLPVTQTGTRDGPAGVTVVLLHYFGSARGEWLLVTKLLEGRWATASIDLPGFGEAAAVPGYSVAEMADAVERAVGRIKTERVILVGHSMSGKVALVLAARGLARLAGLVLVAPSPPGPEPLSAKAMELLLGYCQDRRSAESYLDSVTARPLSGDDRESAIEAFTKANPAAWTAWLKRGSREDWAERVGTVTTPTLLVTGTKDASLGLAVQQKHTLPHLANAQTHDVAGVGHVLPLEAPGTLAGLIADFVAKL